MAIITDKTSGTLELEHVGTYDRQREKRDEAKKKIRAVFEDGSVVFEEGHGRTLSLKMTESLLENAYSKSVFNSAFDELVGEGYLTKDHAEHNKALYTLAEQEG